MAVYKKTDDVSQSVRDYAQHEGNSLVWVNILTGASGHNNFLTNRTAPTFSGLESRYTTRFDDTTYY